MLPYDEQGSGPAVVLLHAGIADRTMWADLLPRLAHGGYRAIALDLPGFGEAVPQPGAPPPWVDVLGTLDELGVDGAAIVGCSYGGAIALRAAALHRGRFWAMVLACAPAPGIDPSPALLERWTVDEPALEAGDLDGATDAVVDAWTLPGAPAELKELVWAAQRRSFELQDGLPEPTHDPDPLADDPDRLPLIPTPTLVITGDLDLVDFREGGKLMARLLGDAELTTLPASGHLPPLEEPDAFEALLSAFLEARRPAA